MTAVTFHVVGLPQPQGSMRAFVPRGWSRPIITSANPNLKGWRALVAAAAPAMSPFEGAVAVHLEFALPRPKSLPKRVVDHTRKPDLDKLVRAVKDALTNVVWRDDSQVVRILATKHYADSARTVGVTVRVDDITLEGGIDYHGQEKGDTQDATPRLAPTHPASRRRRAVRA